MALHVWKSNFCWYQYHIWWVFQSILLVCVINIHQVIKCTDIKDGCKSIYFTWKFPQVVLENFHKNYVHGPFHESFMEISTNNTWKIPQNTVLFASYWNVCNFLTPSCLCCYPQDRYVLAALVCLGSVCFWHGLITLVPLNENW